MLRILAIRIAGGGRLTSPPWRALVLAAGLSLGRAAGAAAEPPAMPGAAAAHGQAASPDSAPAGPAREPAPAAELRPGPSWSGALGINLSYRPEYDGASRLSLVARPALYVRYGRFSLSSGASFAAGRTDGVVRGLGVDLVRGTRTRISLALRHDSGRQEGDSDALRGLGDVKPTLRARLSARRQLDGRWRVAASWNVDALGRGGGGIADAQLIRDWPLASDTVASAALGLSVGGRRYMRSYYGIDEAQSAASGYPVYRPQLGLRDATLSASVRTDLDDHWTLLVGAGASRLLGPAAASPLTQRTTTWGLNAGLARRF